MERKGLKKYGAEDLKKWGAEASKNGAQRYKKWSACRDLKMDPETSKMKRRDLKNGGADCRDLKKGAQRPQNMGCRDL